MRTLVKLLSASISLSLGGLKWSGSWESTTQTYCINIAAKNCRNENARQYRHPLVTTTCPPHAEVSLSTAWDTVQFACLEFLLCPNQTLALLVQGGQNAAQTEDPSGTYRTSCSKNRSKTSTTS